MEQDEKSVKKSQYYLNHCRSLDLRAEGQKGDINIQKMKPKLSEVLSENTS